MTTFSTNSPGYAQDSTAISVIPKSVEGRILMVIFAVLALWGVAIATFGYPAIIIPALIAVPVMFTFLMMITVGK